MKTVIVANTKRQADMIAKEHNLRPWQWRYGHDARSLQGLEPKATILVASNYVETPRHRELNGTRIAEFPVHTEIHRHQMLGGEVAYVAT